MPWPVPSTAVPGWKVPVESESTVPARSTPPMSGMIRATLLFGRVASESLKLIPAKWTSMSTSPSKMSGSTSVTDTAGIELSPVIKTARTR